MSRTAARLEQEAAALRLQLEEVVSFTNLGPDSVIHVTFSVPLWFTVSRHSSRHINPEYDSFSDDG